MTKQQAMRISLSPEKYADISMDCLRLAIAISDLPGKAKGVIAYAEEMREYILFPKLKRKSS